jgi:tetratricopeptide (TPR) repeat protein
MLIFSLAVVIVCSFTSKVMLAIASNPAAVSTAQSYFEQGQLLDSHAKFNESIPFYRAAVRLHPENGYYWYQLAYAEWNAGYCVKILDRIERAVKYNFDQEKCNILLENSNECRNDAPSPQNEPNKVDGSQEIRIIEDAFTLVDLPGHLFEKPFLVRNFLNHEVIQKIQEIFNHPNFGEDFGQEIVEFYPQNMRIKPSRVYRVTLEEALAFLDLPEGAYISSDISEPGTYIQWNLLPNLFAKLWSLFYLSDSAVSHSPLWHNITVYSQLDRVAQQWISLHSHDFTKQVDDLSRLLHWNMLLIGEANAGMFGHVDVLPVASYQLQLFGRKVWIICPPPSSSHMNNIQPQHHDHHDCFDVTVETGDVLYYPPAYYHETLCLDTPTISLSSSLLLPTYTSHFLDFVRRSCRKEIESAFQFSTAICTAIEHKLELLHPDERHGHHRQFDIKNEGQEF